MVNFLEGRQPEEIIKDMPLCYKKIIEKEFLI
jgi:hypothetical protein